MNPLGIDTENLHHAYLIAGDGTHVVPVLEDFLSKTLEYPIGGNPDYVKEEFQLFGVDDSHRINSIQSKKAITQGKKVFVLTCNSFSNEAQNSLLKMFEEPTLDTHFFIIVPTLDSVLPTLRSRVLILDLGDIAKRKPDTAFAKEFFASTVAERLKLVNHIIEDKDKSKAGAFLDDIEHHAHSLLKAGESKDALTLLLQDVLVFRGYLHDRAPSVKILVEHIVHTLPSL
jgi:DNA polymerase III delta prime subunit